jgi:hypothetical protein
MNLRHYLARSVSRPWPARRGCHRRDAPYRPSLEALEGRILPAAVTWINPAGGDWDTAANWSTGALPTAADDVQINTSGITIAIRGRLPYLGPLWDSLNELTAPHPLVRLCIRWRIARVPCLQPLRFEARRQTVYERNNVDQGNTATHSTHGKPRNVR